jgi:hypothetical protein
MPADVLRLAGVELVDVAIPAWIADMLRGDFPEAIARSNGVAAFCRRRRLILCGRLIQNTRPDAGGIRGNLQYPTGVNPVRIGEGAAVRLDATVVELCDLPVAAT